MIIPIFFSIKKPNPEFLKALEERALPEQEARKVCQIYTNRCVQHTKWMKIGAIIFGVDVLIARVGVAFLPNEAYIYLPLLLSVFVGFYLALFGFTGRMNDKIFLKAVEKGYPWIAEEERVRAAKPI